MGLTTSALPEEVITRMESEEDLLAFTTPRDLSETNAITSQDDNAQDSTFEHNDTTTSIFSEDVITRIESEEDLLVSTTPRNVSKTHAPTPRDAYAQDLVHEHNDMTLSALSKEVFTTHRESEQDLLTSTTPRFYSSRDANAREE